MEDKKAPGEQHRSRRLTPRIHDNSRAPIGDIVGRCVDDYHGFRRADPDDITLIVLRRRVT